MDSSSCVPTYKVNFHVQQFVLLIWWNFYSTIAYKIEFFVTIYKAIYVIQNQPDHKNIQSCTGTTNIIFIW
jgi:hypothetical protein